MTKVAKAKIAVAVRVKETAVAAKEETKAPKAAKTEAVLRTAQATMTSHAIRHQETARSLQLADPASACIGIRIRARMERNARSIILLHAETGRPVTARKASYARTGT